MEAGCSAPLFTQRIPAFPAPSHRPTPDPFTQRIHAPSFD